MATLESITYSPHRHSIAEDHVDWKLVGGGKVMVGLPQIIWNNCMPWREANRWALDQATSRDVSSKTVLSAMTALHAYAQWLETTGTDWRHFPQKKKDRCLVRFRGALKKAIENGELASSTASQRMSTVIRFYRWLRAEGEFSPDIPLWRERTMHVHSHDLIGLDRTIAVKSTDLSIKNRKAQGARLEDGLLPVSASDRENILKLAGQHASVELFLLLTGGFFTGARLGTLADLKIETLERAVPDPASPELYRLAVGPAASPPVHTKFGVDGEIRITRVHLDAYREYFYSPRRLKRQVLAAPEHRHLLFLTRFGHPYVAHGSEGSSALNVEMHSFRRLGVAHGLEVLRYFKFHQSRCTFATETAGLAISLCGAVNAVELVKEFLLHRDEATTMRYIKFVEKTPTKRESANAYTQAFLGAIEHHKAVLNA